MFSIAAVLLYIPIKIFVSERRMAHQSHQKNDKKTSAWERRLKMEVVGQRQSSMALVVSIFSVALIQGYYLQGRARRRRKRQGLKENSE